MDDRLEAGLISLILPYWQRQEAADRAFALLDKHYRDLDLEVIVVDDGNAIPFRVPETGLNVRVVTLPRKDEPKAQPTVYNAGVAAANGDIIVLSCVEILHEKPVLRQMVEAVRKGGSKAYVLAAAWCPEFQEWHCHTTKKLLHNAAGTGATFCAAMHKSLYEAAGGFDEDYRDGAGYEDCDFINRMLRAGANFIIRDDLVVTHPKSQAQIRWRSEDFARNLDLYHRKWPLIPPGPAVTFVCLKAGDMYGPDYVNILRDMVTRNLPEGWPGRFVCITDDATGLEPGIETIALPKGIDRWWGKLWMFKQGVFKDGEQIVFLDLDTAIVGSLERLARYRGELATLRDLSGGGGLGPAVICWQAGGKATAYWERWEHAGMPRTFHGDKGWMEHCGFSGDYLQDLFPGDFCSFKIDCKPMFPKGTKVVCFHGEPRPHNCNEEWVRHCWKVGGGTAAELAAVCNTHHDRITRNIRHAMSLGLPELDFAEPHEGNAVIVGGGPSLKSSMHELRQRALGGQTIFATNGAGMFLVEHGILPHHIVILDARPENAAFVLPEFHHFLASHCDPAVFDKALMKSVYHIAVEGILEAVGRDTVNAISTGSTVGLVAIGIAHVLGFRKFHLYGMDSSYLTNHHAYAQPLNDADAVIEAEAGGRKFRCAPWMVHQVQQFQSLAGQLAAEGCILTVAGDGLLPHVARLMGNQLEAA